MASFSKSVTMNQQTTCDISMLSIIPKEIEEATDWIDKCRNKKNKAFKIFLFLVHIGIPLNYCQILTWSKKYTDKRFQKLQRW